METTQQPIHVSVFGLGFVGGAVLKSFQENSVNVVGYDKYKEGQVSSEETFISCLSADIAFLCLPTAFDEAQHSYDQTSIKDVCNRLVENNFKGAVVIKSTVEPGTTDSLCQLYPSLEFIHNPEFLTAVTAYEDFHNQTHIVLGRSANASDDIMDRVSQFYASYYPEADISSCLAIESESMKIYVNCFYATKIQFFNELYALTNVVGGDFNVVVKLMLKNNWINSMHTSVPGTDGMLSYGGGCFPKDTNALLCHMKKSETPHQVISAVISERNSMRTDHTNVIVAQKPETDKVISETNTTAVRDCCKCGCMCNTPLDATEKLAESNTEPKSSTSSKKTCLIC
jgi:nucleotide sugar dehydrogenase